MFPSLPPFHDTFGRWARAVVVVAGLVSLSGVAHAESPGLDAIEEFKTPKESHPAVDNRFFLKENRFEFSPMVGYVPNNPYAKRYVGGVQLGYHFGEVRTVTAKTMVRKINVCLARFFGIRSCRTRGKRVSARISPGIR